MKGITLLGLTQMYFDRDERKKINLHNTGLKAFIDFIFGLNNINNS